MRLSTILVLFVAGILFNSCEKNIKVSAPPYSSKVSIQSMLEPDSIPIVYFNRTVPYFDQKVSLGELVIRNARITISTNNISDTLLLDSSYNKIYCEYDYYYKGHQPIKINSTYSLNISDGPNTYSAATTIDLKAASIDSISYTPTFSDLYGEHEGVIVYFKDVLHQENFYRYTMERFIDTSIRLASQKIVSLCLGKDSVFVHEIGRSVYNDQGIDGQQIKIVIEPAYSHKKGTSGKIRIQTIDRNAYDFFDQLDKQKLSQLNPFVEPVFLKDGQFGSKAVGYFSSMVLSNPVSFTFPE